MTVKRATTNAIILLASISISILICEALSRLILNPADYLSPRMKSDRILGHTIDPASSGFDEWGFRNKSIPSTADIVAVGDSHTYGNTATMGDSWPSVLARMTGLEVYNLGLGGYGPNQYYYLLKNKGLMLHPKWVVCGLYMGDDFENAFSITYGLDYWASLRKGRYDNVRADNWDPGPPVLGASVRNWLSSQSMIYRLLFHGPVLTMVKEAIQFKHVFARSDPFTTALIADDQRIREAFRPIGISERLDQNSDPIREGMRITFHLLNEMDSMCRQEGCRFLVVIIPTKETVFGDYLEKNSQLHLHEALDRVITNERSARKALFEYLDRSGIAYLDTLSALKLSVGEQLYAHTTRDMHPNKNGYKIIGEAVAGYLRTHP
jgi:hypothetical protein